MPKSSLFHDRDGEAIDALRSILPKFWLYKDPANKFGGKEYSEDLIIEIVNDDVMRTVTGIEFGIQNKTDVEIRKRHVTIKLSANDIERLRGLQRPILLHAYHIPSKTSYWLWLDEWYVINYRKVSETKRKGPNRNVTVNIPKHNVLDVKAVAKIVAYARWEHHKQQLRKAANMVNRAQPNDYNIDIVEAGERSVTMVVNAMRDETIPVLHVLDQTAMDAIIQARETGEPVPLTGSIALSNIPEFIQEHFGETLDSAWVFPIPPESKSSPLKFELLDADNQVIHKSPYILMHLVRPGTVISSWQGSDTQHNVTYAMTFDRRAVKTTFNVNFGNSGSDNPLELRDYMRRLDQLRPVNQIRVTHLETEESTVISASGLFDRDLTLQEEISRRMIEALATIDEILHVTIPLPKRIDSKLLNRAEWVAEALRDGAAKINGKDFIPDNMVLICGDSAQSVRKFVASYEENGSLKIRLPSTTVDFKIELLKHNLDLGPAYYACGNLKILNLDELRDVFARKVFADETTVNTVFEVDRNEVYIAFSKWSPPSDETDNPAKELF